MRIRIGWGYIHWVVLNVVPFPFVLINSLFMIIFNILQGLVPQLARLNRKRNNMQAKWVLKGTSGLLPNQLTNVTYRINFIIKFEMKFKKEKKGKRKKSQYIIRRMVTLIAAMVFKAVLMLYWCYADELPCISYTVLASFGNSKTDGDLSDQIQMCPIFGAVIDNSS